MVTQKIKMSLRNVLVLLGISLFIVSCSVPEAKQTTEKISEPLVEEQTTATWHEIARWEGEGMKDTETFTVPSREWVVSWKTWPRTDAYGTWESNFAIMVYKENGQYYNLAANVIGSSEDSSVMRGSGNYYLSINSGQPYIVVVQAKY